MIQIVEVAIVSSLILHVAMHIWKNLELAIKLKYIVDKNKLTVAIL